MSRPATRPSTLAGALSDRHNLESYLICSTLRTVAQHPDLMARLALTKDEGWRSYKPLQEEADKRNDSRAASDGTNIHMVVEALHGGMDVSRLPDSPRQEGEAVYEAIRASGYSIVESEMFVVCMDLPELLAGTTDLILRHDATGQRFVADTKSVAELTDLRYSLPWGIQTAVYAHGFPYHGEVTRDRWGRPLIDESMVGFWSNGDQPDRTRSLIIQVQRGTKKVRMDWLDIEEAYFFAQLACHVRAARRVNLEASSPAWL